MPIKFFRVKIFNYTLGFYYIKTITMEGFTSKCEDGSSVLFWDFIEAKKEEIINALLEIQLKYSLGNIYIFQSGVRDSFRGICLDKFKMFKDAIEIVRRTDYLDVAFLKWSLIRYKFTLRLSPKGKEKSHLIGILKNTSNRETSEAHYKILLRLFPEIAKIKNNNFDISDIIEYVKFDTANIPKIKEV